jgi:hypothetical protein
VRLSSSDNTGSFISSFFFYFDISLFLTSSFRGSGHFRNHRKRNKLSESARNPRTREPSQFCRTKVSKRSGRLRGKMSRSIGAGARATTINAIDHGPDDDFLERPPPPPPPPPPPTARALGPPTFSPQLNCTFKMTLRNSSRFVLRDLGLARTRPFTTTRASVVGGGNRRNFFVYIETAPAAGSPSPSRPHLPHPTVSPARRIVRSNGSIKYKQRHLVLRPSAPRATQLIRISREFWILRERLVPGRWGSGNRSALMKLNAGGKWDGWDGWVHVSASASFPRPPARQAQGDQGGSRARAFMNLGQDERLLPPLSLSLSLT